MTNQSRFGFDGYARILHSFMKKQGTARDLVKRGLCCEMAALRISRAMHQLGLLHICAWRAEPGRQYHPVFKFGDGQDYPPPSLRPNRRPINSPITVKIVKTPIDLHGFHLLIEALHAPSTVLEISAETGLHAGAIRRAALVMHELHMIYIADWQRIKNGAPLERWKWGNQPDAERIKPDPAAACRRYRERKRELKRLAMFSSVFSEAARHSTQPKA